MSKKTNNKKNAGQQPKTQEECLEAFEAFTSALEVTSLRLSRDPKGRYSIGRDIDGVSSEHVVGPLAGNSFVRLLRGSESLAAAVAACKVA